MTTTKALWAQEAHLRPSESQGLILHIKMKRGLCKTPQIHPKPTQPIHTRAHTHTHAHTYTYISDQTWDLMFLGPSSQVKGRKHLGLCRMGVDGPSMDLQKSNQDTVLPMRPST